MAENYPCSLDSASVEAFWASDAFSHESEAPFGALQDCLYSDTGCNHVLAASGPAFPVTPEPFTPASDSGVETTRRRIRPNHALSLPTAGKITKRKRSTSTRSTTTFITVDAANFRQMVQQLTGIRFPGEHAAAEAVLRPEPRRAGSGVAMPVGFLPTLDTSAIWLERAAPSPRSPASFGSGPDGFEFDMDPPFPGF